MDEQAPNAPGQEESRRHNATLEGINRVLKAALNCATEQDLGVACLGIAQELTQSAFGFIGELNDGLLYDIALSNPGWHACSGLDPDGHRVHPGSFTMHGIYGRVLSDGRSLFTNDLASHPYSVGLPAGHPPIHAFLGVPLVRESRVGGLIAVANRPGGYSRQEQEILECLAPAVVEAFQRKRAVQALRASEARLHLACRAAHAGAWEWDLRSNKVIWSDDMWKVYGVPPGSLEPSYQVWLDTVHPEDRDRVDTTVLGAVRGGSELAVEWRLGAAGGGERWLMSLAQPQYDENGAIVSYVGISMDVTARKQAEEALRHSENKFSILFHQASLPAVLSRFPDHTLIDVNEAWAQLFGFRREEAIGKTGVELGVSRNLAHRATLSEQVRRHAQVRNLEQTYYAKSGATLTVLVNVNVVEIDGEQYALTSLQDITARKRAEEELRASEEKFSTMFRSAPIAISLATLPDGAVHDVNPAWLKLAGYDSKEEVLGKTSLELGLICDTEARGLILEEFRRQGFVRDAEQDIITVSGLRRSLLVSLDRVELAGQAFILAVMEDVTERKHAEQELRRHRDHLDALVKERTAQVENRNEQLIREAGERLKVESELLQSEQRYRGIVQYQTVYVNRYLPGGILTFVNDALVRVTGRAPDQLLGASFFPFIHEEDRPQVLRTIAALSEEAPIAETEARVLLPDGVHWQRWEHRAIFDAEGGIAEYQSVGRDVTQQKLAEQALLASEQRYRAVVEDQTELISRHRPDGRFTFVNEAYCRFFGKTHDELVGGSWRPDAFAEDVPRIQEQLRLMSPENPAVVIENRVISGKGELHWMQFVNRGLFDAEGRLVEMQVVGHDVTRQKEVEQTLKKYAQRLIMLEEELRRKVSMELHDDIGQELTALDFNLTHIRKKLSPESDRKVSGLLEDSRVLTKEINHTVRNLMLDLRPSQLDIYGLGGAIESYTRHYGQRTGVEVAVHLPPEFPRLAPEKEISLFRIAQEALNNVAKYAGATKVTISLESDNARVRLSISDDGKGFRLQRSALRPLESGWGLTIMRERAEMVGGSFSIDSRVGAGTTIVVQVGATD